MGKRIQTTIDKILMNKIDKIVFYYLEVFQIGTKSEILRRAIKYYLDNIIEIEKEELLENYEYLRELGYVSEDNFYKFMKRIMAEINNDETSIFK